VTPPTLAVTLGMRGWIGVLAGARSPNLMRRIYTASGPLKLHHLRFPACPDQFVFSADDPETLAALAEGAGLCLQRDAPTALLMCLPSVDDPSVRCPVPLPLGSEWRIDRFSPEDLRWRGARREDAEATDWGLFRFTFRHQQFALLCSEGKAFRVPGQVGKFLALRRHRRWRSILRYDRSARIFTFPASCRPPFLVERALLLCSGALPSFQPREGAAVLHYAGIPNSIASTAAALLRQRLP
jgi:hypothetical protein